MQIRMRQVFDPLSGRSSYNHQMGCTPFMAHRLRMCILLVPTTVIDISRDEIVSRRHWSQYRERDAGAIYLATHPVLCKLASGSPFRQILTSV